MTHRSLRICLLTYRGNPSSGGQGVYARMLSKALAELGHEVEVWSGQPYPELVDGVRLRPVPSLDLWNEQAFFRTPSLRELIDPINLEEFAQTRTGGFPEPVTFSRRVHRSFRSNGASKHFDIVHDNQCLGPGLLGVRTMVPVVATIHHPITVDRRLALESAEGWLARYGLKRWYGFLPAQLRVARQLDRILTVSDAARRDVVREYGVEHHRTRVVGNGIDVDVFQPQPQVARDPLALLATLSADAPLKGFRHLVDAMAALASRFPALRLTVIGSPGSDTDTTARIERLGLARRITFTGRVPVERIAEEYARSSIAVVPSLYEGFGYPAGEAMACEVPVVSTRAGALPEVIGQDGLCGALVEPASGAALAAAIAALLEAPERRAAMGRAGRARVLDRFTWRATAERTVEVYREVLEARGTRAC